MKKQAVAMQKQIQTLQGQLNASRETPSALKALESEVLKLRKSNKQLITANDSLHDQLLQLKFELNQID